MGKPCKYPRHPTGPSGFGESGVRRLQGKGGDYQRSRPSSDLLSIQSGDFSRVIIEGEPEYLSTGNDLTLKVRDTNRYQQPFKPSLARIGRSPVNLGGGTYATSRADFVFIDEPLTLEYEVLPGVVQNATFRVAQYNQTVRFGGYFVRGELMANYVGFYIYQFSGTSQQVYIKAADTVANYGRREQAGRSAVGVGTGFALGRYDAVGRPLSDVFLYRMSRQADNETLPLVPSAFTREEAEFWPQHPLIVLKDYTLTLAAETHFRPGPYDPSEDYRPKFWIAATPNDEGFGTFTYTDMTPTIFAGALVPDPEGFAPIQYWSTTRGRQYGADLSATLLTLMNGIAVVGDNQFIMAWQHRMPGGWRQRVAVVSIAGGSASGVLTYESDDNTNRASVPLWQNIVHLGNGVVLAKIISGWPGTGHTVTFRRSMDGGTTWGAAFSPSGFESALLNQFYGDFIVDERLTDERPGKVLIPAWNAATLAYHVYESRDMGSTWTRRGRIYTPNEFRRVDTILTGDGGGNFRFLVPGPSRTRPADITLPDRYKDRS
jgi:hypothetical protein